MKLQDQVVSLQQAKQLKQLGVVQNSVWYWSDKFDDNGQWRLWWNNFDDPTVVHPDLCSAFTVAELGVMLPDDMSIYSTQGFGTAGLRINTSGEYWICECRHLSGTVASTEAQARAAMLIHLLETSIIEVEAANARLA